MYLGEIIEHGTAEQIFEHPQNPITKSYIKGTYS
jgi:ABC-type oligopeptide transport system ATPase subunit